MRLRIAVVAAAPALRAGLGALLAVDPGLHPVPLDDLTLAGDSPDAIVIDYSLGEPEAAAVLAEALSTTPLILIGADPATDGPGLADAPVAYLPMDIEAVPLAAAVRAGHWLADQQSEDGCWRKFEPNDTPVSYTHLTLPTHYSA